MNDNEIESLKTELEHEKSCREAAAWQNNEIEKQIVSMQEELRKNDYPWDKDDDLQKESGRHKQLLDAIETLKEQLPILKERIKNAKACGPDCKLKHDDLNINLDILTPAELLRTVKRFERLKTDLISTLRSREWRLDSESKSSEIITHLYNHLWPLTIAWVIINVFTTFMIGIIEPCVQVGDKFSFRYWKCGMNPSVSWFGYNEGISALEHSKQLLFWNSLFVRVHDQRTYLQNELMICHNNIMRLQKNGSFWQHVPRKNDERILDPKRGPIKKIFCNDRLPPIAT